MKYVLIKMKLLLISFFLLYFASGCKNSTNDIPNRQELKGAVSVLSFPENNHTVILEKEDSILFKWEPLPKEGEEKVYYDILFDTPGGNFSQPIHGIVSRNNGLENWIKVAHLDLDKIAAKAGIEPEKQGDIKWTVRASYMGMKGNLSLSSNVLKINRITRPKVAINVVASLKENSLKVNWVKPEIVKNLKELTMECLVYNNQWGGSEANIQSLMGIEGYFLLRFGDANFAEQLQVATGFGNFPDKDQSKKLSSKKWMHLSVTVNTVNGEYHIYVDGIEQSAGKTKGSVPLDFSVNHNGGFFIGRSWNDNRWFNGNIAECRIWNVIRTGKEIRRNMYTIDPKTPGLMAYWKFNEGKGNIVKDATGNNNDAIAKSDLKWIPVILPEDAALN